MRFLALILVLILGGGASGHCANSYEVKGEAGSVVGILDLGRTNKTMKDACQFSIERAEAEAMLVCDSAGGKVKGNAKRTLEITGRSTPTCTVVVTLTCEL